MSKETMKFTITIEDESREADNTLDLTISLLQAGVEKLKKTKEETKTFNEKFLEKTPIAKKYFDSCSSERQAELKESAELTFTLTTILDIFKEISSLISPTEKFLISAFNKINNK
jgi:hypothetical protein